jgi:hypothetical protein
LKSAWSHFAANVFPEHQAHDPCLLRVFASSREPSLLWNETSREAAKNAKKGDRNTNATSLLRPISIATVPSGLRNLPTRHVPRVRKPARQPLAARVGIGIGIGIGIENSKGRTGSDPNTPRHPRALPSRGPRPGGPKDSSPRRQPWVVFVYGTPAPAGRQNPFHHTSTSIRSRHQSTTTPRNTNRISREASKPQSPQMDEQPARQTLGARVGIGIGIGIGIENSLMSPRAASSGPKLIFTPRRRARRGWNTAGAATTTHKSPTPGKGRSKTVNLPPRGEISPLSGASDRLLRQCPLERFLLGDRLYLPLTPNGHRCPRKSGRFSESSQDILEYLLRSNCHTGQFHANRGGLDGFLIVAHVLME